MTGFFMLLLVGIILIIDQIPNKQQRDARRAYRTRIKLNNYNPLLQGQIENKYLHNPDLFEEETGINLNVIGNYLRGTCLHSFDPEENCYPPKGGIQRNSMGLAAAVKYRLNEEGYEFDDEARYFGLEGEGSFIKHANYDIPPDMFRQGELYKMSIYELEQTLGGNYYDKVLSELKRKNPEINSIYPDVIKKRAKGVLVRCQMIKENRTWFGMQDRYFVNKWGKDDLFDRVEYVDKDLEAFAYKGNEK